MLVKRFWIPLFITAVGILAILALPRLVLRNSYPSDSGKSLRETVDLLSPEERKQEYQKEWKVLLSDLLDTTRMDRSAALETARRFERICFLTPTQDDWDIVPVPDRWDERKVRELLKNAEKDASLPGRWQIAFCLARIESARKESERGVQGLPDDRKALDSYIIALQNIGEHELRQDLLLQYLRCRGKLISSDNNPSQRVEAFLEIPYSLWKESDLPGDRALFENCMKNGIEGLFSKGSFPLEAKTKALICQIQNEVFGARHLCQSCFHPTKAGERFCAQCGSAIPVWGICKKCAAVLQDDALFCVFCGEKTVDEIPPVPMEPAASEKTSEPVGDKGKPESQPPPKGV